MDILLTSRDAVNLSQNIYSEHSISCTSCNMLERSWL